MAQNSDLPKLAAPGERAGDMLDAEADTMIAQKRARHVNARTEGEKLRIVKCAEHLKIDLAVELSMAAHHTSRLNE
jgi:hypothetical protein